MFFLLCLGLWATLLNTAPRCFNTDAQRRPLTVGLPLEEPHVVRCVPPSETEVLEAEGVDKPEELQRESGRSSVS